ncbi:(Na+)-NQR maturation NqrM [Colwellia sp. C1TZA3]|uniref:(Na+)-NQR maturation NqrM n=1 Tax=Colwellia sp. C1TZA3 TaxID=2508879 RepID=UPI0011BA125F|nr:(Na+)-NQR maturation NqrM [Colwellia sp. C1TZA3]TWX70375.1 (Na+)-NQR maturation NqrM [Colwellia sp. C1TZA3]
MVMFLITLVFFLVIVMAMAVGYIFQNKTLAGSCGGLANVGIDKSCNCDDPCEKRQERDRVAGLKIGDISVKNI